MRFSFSESDPNKATGKILDELGGRELGKMVDFSLTNGQLTVTISKLGTSKLVFDQSTKDDGLEYTLASEKIAFAHKAFKGDVVDKLCKVIERVGGQIIER